MDGLILMLVLMCAQQMFTLYLRTQCTLQTRLSIATLVRTGRRGL